jgi:hypothetical protein
MRVIALVTLLLLAGITGARADTEVHGGGDGDSIEYSGSDSGGGSNGGGNNSSGGGDGGYYEEHPYLSHDENGDTCVATEYRRYDTQQEAQQAAEADDMRWQRLTRDYPPCPSSPAPSGSSAAEAQAFWGTVPLPKPTPEIDPGWAVTGRKSFLETGSTPTAQFTRDTPRGQLVIDATGPYYVDWGDGTQSGPYDEAGGPWPNGTITHVYEDVGTYDVVVTQRWSATWHMSNGESGRLGGLQTVGRIDDFRVDQLQAVRNR